MHLRFLVGRYFEIGQLGCEQRFHLGRVGCSQPVLCGQILVRPLSGILARVEFFELCNRYLRNFCSVAISAAGVGAIDGLTMLIPAYDPVAIAVLGFSIVLAAGLAFAF